MQPQPYIPKTTAEVEAAGIYPAAGRGLSFFLSGTLAAGEEIAIEYQDADGEWQTLVEDGLDVVLSVDNKVASTDKPGVYRANKPLTVAAAGVTVCR
ncbi:MAG: hypothetical protein ACOY4W_16670 [Thermodesulfobacteriota bacterium]